VRLLFLSFCILSKRRFTELHTCIGHLPSACELMNGEISVPFSACTIIYQVVYTSRLPSGVRIDSIEQPFTFRQSALHSCALINLSQFISRLRLIREKNRTRVNQRFTDDGRTDKTCLFQRRFQPLLSARCRRSVPRTPTSDLLTTDGQSERRTGQNRITKLGWNYADSNYEYFWLLDSYAAIVGKWL